VLLGNQLDGNGGAPSWVRIEDGTIGSWKSSREIWNIWYCEIEMHFKIL